MWIAIGCGVGLVLILGLIFLLRSRGQKGMVSIAMLRTAPRAMTEADVRGAFRRAFGSEPELHKQPGPDSSVDLFIVSNDSVPPVGIINCRRPYMSPEEAKSVASTLEHQAARTAMTDHKAWIAVDAMGIDRSTRQQRSAIYPLLGKLAAEFHDPGCMLLYLPAENRIAQPGLSTETMLREGRIAELFGDDDLHAPISNVSKDDAEISKAIEEARSRLPEFLSAFESRGPATKAMFKARFTTQGDEVEVIWLSLQEITDTHLVGTIENRPIHPSLPKKGEKTRVKLDSVVDWAYLDEKQQPVGMFVDRILMRRGR